MRMKRRLAIVRKYEQVSISEQRVAWVCFGSEYDVNSKILSRTSTGQPWIIVDEVFCAGEAWFPSNSSRDFREANSTTEIFVC